MQQPTPTFSSRSPGTRDNRRRTPRFPVGLPVGLKVAGRSEPLMVEIVDISSGGIRFCALGDAARIGERASLRFVLADQRACAAAGWVARVGRLGEFVLTLTEANEAFRAFVAQMSAETL